MLTVAMSLTALRLLKVPSFLCLLFLASACGGGGGEEHPFTLESELVTQAAQPDALAFAPDGRLFYVEHWTGNIRVITADGQLLPDPFAHISDSASAISWGLTGLALDPDFQTNHYVYAYYTAIIDAGPPPRGRPTVIRFTDTGNSGAEPTIVVGDLPEGNAQSAFNANGSLHFGPDGLLYLTFGDNDMSAVTGPQGNPMPQDLGTAIGKILRVQRDGTAAADNPFVEAGDPRIFAYGFRAAFNFAFHSATGKIYGSDSLGVSCDKLNIIEKGANYGWPQSRESTFDCLAVGKVPIHLFAREGMQPGDFQSTVGIAGMEFVSGNVYPTLGDVLLVCESASGLMRRLVLEGPGFDTVAADDVVTENCGSDITASPEGIVYYSNQTEIWRLVPAEVAQAGESGRPGPSSPAP